MKIRHLTTCLFLSAVMAAAFAFTALAAVPAGRMEKVTDTQIIGWAYQKDMPHSPIHVRVAVKDADGHEVFSQKVTADEYREDLAREGKGNGCHGFTVSIDWSSLEDGVYTIEGYADDRTLTRTLTYTNGNPQEEASAKEETAPTPQLVSLGTFKTTGYCPCSRCSEGWGRHTCTGALATARHTIAVDPKVIPYGTQVMINGVVYTAEDKGGGVRGNHIDIFFDNHAETLQHGTQNVEVFLIAA